MQRDVIRRAATIADRVDATLYPDSVVVQNESVFCLFRTGVTKQLTIFSQDTAGLPAPFEGSPEPITLDAEPYTYWRCPRTAGNAAALRETFAWLRPMTLGTQRSAGCGDRLGLATPGHARAIANTFTAETTGVMPIFAQQSIRENSRTGRTPQEVVDDATWGVFEAGWQRGYGADADHLKTPADVEATVAAGYSFFTIDPGDHVVSGAATLTGRGLEQQFDTLPWETLEDTPADCRARYLGQPFETDDGRLAFDERQLAVAAVKYGRAVAHTVTMYRHLVEIAGEDVELEVSVDETESPTTHLEHLYIANELARLGVDWVSLAPRYVGRFEKGVDYLGTDGTLDDEALHAFRRNVAGHAAIARTMGPYKLSLHSGSDKFSIYPIVAEETEGLVHLKTAGTSYLEALRAIAAVEPALFREIYAFAIERYPEDRATYHVSAAVERMPAPETVSAEELPAVLDHFDARQALHVTFGSVLNATDPNGKYRFKSDLDRLLREHEEAHYRVLETHFDRHLAPFAAV